MSDFNAPPSNKVRIANLPFSVNWINLKDMIRSEVGEVDFVDQIVKGIFVCTFSDVAKATACIEALNETTYENRTLSVSYYADKRKPTDGSCVYLTNLPYTITWFDLKDLAREYGNVLYADVLKNSDDRSRGTGYITFSNAEEAAAAVEALNECDIRNRTISAYIYSAEKPVRVERV